LQCDVYDSHETYQLQRKITVGDRDECSPAAGLEDAEGNFYNHLIFKILLLKNNMANKVSFVIE
jgi:hypothetical protein